MQKVHTSDFYHLVLLVNKKFQDLFHSTLSKLIWHPWYIFMGNKAFGSLSPFPHGTCTLSVSRPYLVLEEIYLPLRAALPSNPTLRYNMTTAETHRYVRASHPLRDPIPRNFSRGHDAQRIRRLQFGMGTMQILGLNSSRFTRRY